jgi:hypothetical protein
MTDTRPHPWKIALFPSTNGGFCKLGCQLFYVEVSQSPSNMKIVCCSYLLLSAPF